MLIISLFNSEHDLRSFTYKQVVFLFIYLVLRINKLKIQLLVYDGRLVFNTCLCKGLANTDPFATKERAKTEGMSGFSFWGQVIRGSRIEPFRNILLRIDPLSRVIL
jgi:ABC-type maltose transport system permease subunit